MEIVIRLREEEELGTVYVIVPPGIKADALVKAGASLVFQGPPGLPPRVTTTPKGLKRALGVIGALLASTPAPGGGRA